MIKIGTHRLSAAQIAENICTALPEILTHVPGAWKNIDSIGIKTATSLTLPLYNAVEPSPLVASESIKGQFVDASAKPTKAAATPKAAAAKTSATPKTETKSAAKTEVKSAVKTETKKGKQSKKAVADVEMDEASFEQMLQESGLEVPADEQDEELEDGSDVEEEEVVQPKSTKGAAVAKSSLITAAKAARDDIAARPKSKVAAAKAKSKTASKK
jgi:ribosome biogenesis protein UTP30